jgi:hypothetical protein
MGGGILNHQVHKEHQDAGMVVPTPPPALVGGLSNTGILPLRSTGLPMCLHLRIPLCWNPSHRYNGPLDAGRIVTHRNSDPGHPPRSMK